MGWDAAIHGRLVIPSDQREAWLAAELDWASVPGHAAWDGPVHGKHVRDVVDGRGFVGEEGIEFLELAWSGDELCVRSFMAEDGFIDHVIGLAAAWAAAAPFGGRGELIGMGMLTAAFGYRLRVGEGRASFEAVPDDEVDDLDDHPDAEAIEARVVTASESLLAEYGDDDDDDDDDDDEDDEAPAKPAAKKPAAKKPAAKKPAAKKPAAKKPAAKKPAAKKPAAKKPASKKPASKKPR